MSFSDVDLIRVSPTGSVTRDMVVPSKSREIDLNGKTEDDELPPPKSSVPTIMLTLLTVSIGVSIAYFKYRRMRAKLI